MAGRASIIEGKMILEGLQVFQSLIFEGSLEVKLPTIWTDERRRWEESERREEQKREDAGARKGRKVAKHCVFPMICVSGGSKSRLAKAAGAEPAGQMRDEKLHAVEREAHFQVKMYKTPHAGTNFGSCDVEKVRVVAARSTCRSQYVQNTPDSDHFWKLRCRKSARRCGAKHISKSKCTKPVSDHFWKLRCRKSAGRCGAKQISTSKC